MENKANLIYYDKEVSKIWDLINNPDEYSKLTRGEKIKLGKKKSAMINEAVKFRNWVEK